MTNLFKKLTLEKLGIFSFLIFFILTPLLLKWKIAEGVYVEPLSVFLGLSVILLVLNIYFKHGSKKFWGDVKRLFIPNKLAAFYFVLIAFLFLSFAYGFVLTGLFSAGDLLRLVKYSLYFLPFPLALYAGRRLGRDKVSTILAIFVAVGIATAAISLIRIYLYFNSEIVFEPWTRHIYSRSVGFLGQFFDPFQAAFGSTGKSAGPTYGLYASVVLAALLGIISRLKQITRVRFFWSTLAIVVVSGAILYTLSRSAVLVETLVVGGWILWSRKSPRLRLAVISLLIVILTNAALLWASPQVQRKFSSTVSLKVSETANFFDDEIEEEEAATGEVSTEIVIDRSTMGRIQRWGRVLEMFKREPAFAVFGVGYNVKNLHRFAEVTSPHSFFLDVWARGGLVALFLATAVWVLLLKKVLNLVFSRDTAIRAIGFPLLGFALGWFIDNLISGEPFFSDAPMIAFWGVLGLVQALSRSRESGVGSKKILLALTSTGVGGAPKVVYDLLSQAKARSQEPGVGEFEFIIAGPPGKFLREFRKLGYKTYSVRLDEISFGSFRKFLRIVRKEQVDLINSHGKGAGIYARATGAVTGVKVVHTIHGIHYSKTNFISRNLYFLSEKILSVLTTLVINVSKNQEKEGLKLKIFPKNKSRVVLNGIEVKKARIQDSGARSFRRKLGIGEKEFAVAMVARFDPPGVRHKGHERFIKLIPDLVRVVPNLKTLFVGGPSTSSGQAKRLARKLGVSGATIFLGERGDVPKILAASDAFVLPSYHEGLPISVLEASAAGLPVIGSKVVGIKDAVRDGETGFLVDFDRPAAVSAAFKKLSRSPALRRRMGERGREFVGEKFSMGKFVDSTLRVYREALVE